MPTPLKYLGSPAVGRSIVFGARAENEVPATVPNNRVIRRVAEIRVEDVPHYIVPIESPTLYDDVFTNAVIVGQSIEEKAGDRTVCYLHRVFAEIPKEWDETVERAETFFGVAKSMLYAPGDFAFRNSVISLRTRCRISRRYFLGNPGRIVESARFQPVDNDGVAVNVITDDTVPSSDEYIAMVNGRQEIVLSSISKQWMGDIHFLETIYSPAK